MYWFNLSFTRGLRFTTLPHMPLICPRENNSYTSSVKPHLILHLKKVLTSAMSLQATILSMTEEPKEFGESARTRARWVFMFYGGFP